MAWRVFLAFCALYLFTVRGHYGGDGFLTYLTAESIIRDRDLAIFDRPFPLVEWEATVAERQTTTTVGADGRHYSQYGLGLAIVEVPFVTLGLLASGLFPERLRDYLPLFTASLTNAFVGAGLVAATFAYARRLGYGARAALVGAVLLGAATICWSYAAYGFAEPLFALTVVLALIALAAADRADRPTPACFAVGLGAGAGLVVQVYAALFVAPALAAWATWQGWRQGHGWRAVLAFAAGVALGLAVLAWSNLTRFGVVYYGGRTLFVPGGIAPEITIQGRAAFAEPADHLLWLGVWGLLFSTGKSFFLYNPPALLAVVALRPALRRHRPLVLFTAFVAAACVLYKGALPTWHGDWAWGPRYLFHLVPLAVILGLPVIERWLEERRLGRLAVLGGIGLIVQVGVLVVNVGDYIRLVGEQHLPLLHFSPRFSPIVGHWFVLIGAAKQWATGAPLVLPGPAGPVVYGADFRADLWFAHLAGFISAPIVGVATLVAGIIAVVVWITMTRGVWNAGDSRAS